MSQKQPAALKVALAYYEAWTGKDLERAMSYIADDVICDAPAGRIEGAEGYRGFIGPFIGIVTGSSIIAAYGDENTALVMYDCATVPVPDAPGAECVTVVDGKITHSRFLFDRLPFEQVRRAQGS